MARHFAPTEWRGRLHDVVAVHPDRARFDVLGEERRLVNILRPDACRQAVIGIVGAPNPFVDIL